jgi:hypothetical protein
MLSRIFNTSPSSEVFEQKGQCMRAKVWACGLVLLFCVVGSAQTEDASAGYRAMAPLTKYLSMHEAEEIALARSAAPTSIAANADILTLGGQGYTTAIKGTNGFVCLVERSWATGFADAEFWNPKFRAPICHNRAAAHAVLPSYIERTGWVLAGASISEMAARARVSAKTFMLPDAGAMSYMLSKQTHLHDADGHWHPHVMFYLANTDAAAWGANLDGSPIFADSTGVFGEKGSAEPITTFFVPVAKWSDGTLDIKEAH